MVNSDAAGAGHVAADEDVRTPGAIFIHARSILCAFLFTLLFLAVPSFADESMPSEYQVKAAFLINFPKYVEWPEAAFASANSPIVIAVPGESKVAGELEKIIAGRTVNGREIVLKRMASGADPGVCHLLFISAAEQKHSPNLAAKLKRGILTVGESEDFLESGGVINLARREQKISLEVNLTAATAAGIKISSKLLSLAGVVKGQTK